MMTSRAIPKNHFLQTILRLQSSQLVEYPCSIAKMQQIISDIKEKKSPEVAWFLEHPSLYTQGTSAKTEDIFNTKKIPTFQTGRGGQWTYHGPGQRVIYLMLDLTNRHGVIPERNVHAYVHGLELWLIHALAKFGLKGEQRPDRIGVWVINPQTQKEEKIAAIGVRITKWVSWHGIALNVNPDLEYFKGIVPCGITDYGVASLYSLGIKASMQEVDEALVESWPEIFGTPLSPLKCED